jgi:hypothetical protein
LFKTHFDEGEEVHNIDQTSFSQRFEKIFSIYNFNVGEITKETFSILDQKSLIGTILLAGAKSALPQKVQLEPSLVNFPIFYFV